MTGHRLHHVGIVVPKRETVEAILPLLGLSLGVSQWVPEYQAECLFTAGEGTRLEFIIPRGGKLAEFQPGRGGLHHVAIEVPDLDALMDAVAAGKDVYSEKPFSYSIEQGAKMVKAVRATKQIVQVGMQRRSSEAVRSAKKLVDDGVLGEVVMAIAWKLGGIVGLSVLLGLLAVASVLFADRSEKLLSGRRVAAIAMVIGAALVVSAPFVYSIVVLYRLRIVDTEVLNWVAPHLAVARAGNLLYEAWVSPLGVLRMVGLIALMGVENGWGIGTDLTNVKLFYDRGARYLSLAHDGHNQLTDSATGENDGVWRWNGLSPLGRQVVEEANRLGIMMDISHPSKASNLQVMAMSKAPVIASHSGVRALSDQRRNLDDEQLLALKKNGGVAQMVALSSFVKTAAPDAPERAAAIAALRTELGMGARGGQRAAPSDSLFAVYRQKMAAIDAKFPPPPRATVQDFVNHIDYAVKLIGIDHVGISSDFDGGGGVQGYDNASESINVTTELVRRGYERIADGNRDDPTGPLGGIAFLDFDVRA